MLPSDFQEGKKSNATVVVVTLTVPPIHNSNSSLALSCLQSNTDESFGNLSTDGEAEATELLWNTPKKFLHHYHRNAKRSDTFPSATVFGFVAFTVPFIKEDFI